MMRIPFVVLLSIAFAMLVNSDANAQVTIGYRDFDNSAEWKTTLIRSPDYTPSLSVSVLDEIMTTRVTGPSDGFQFEVVHIGTHAWSPSEVHEDYFESVPIGTVELGLRFQSIPETVLASSI